MERKAVIVGLVVLLAVGLVAAVMWSDDDRADGSRVAQLDGEGSSGGSGLGSSGGSSAGGSSSGGPLRSGQRQADALGDGGVRRPRVPNPNVERPPPTVNTHGELQQSSEDAARSAGWRLGQARARIEMVEARVTHLRETVAEAERQGDATAEQQRAILRRFEARLTALRAEEPTLEAQARQDGTLGDVARGMQEGVDPTLPSRPPPGRTP